MRKLFITVCCTLFMMSCSGSGNGYVDAMVELNEKTISNYENAKTADEVYLITGTYVQEVKNISEKHKEEALDFVQKSMKGDKNTEKLQHIMQESIDKTDAAKNQAIERVGIDLENL